MKIVVDAMGGDHAPENVIAGVVEALQEYNVTIVLVGIKERIESELQKYKYPKDRVVLIHAPEVVEMDDHAAVAIRQKKNSSMSIDPTTEELRSHIQRPRQTKPARQTAIAIKLVIKRAFFFNLLSLIIDGLIAKPQ